MNERHLLWEYAKTRSDAAFEKLVSRYLDLVYSAAMRQLDDAHQAEDVLHAVFIILGKKAASLPRNVVLPAWLLETTRLAVLDAQRSGVHAQRKPAESTPANPHDEILPLLDEVLAHLSINDRNALVLHYFEKRPLGEVSAALAISQNAAYKWISRGLENMCTFFVRRGVKIGAPALSTVLQTRTVVPVPPDLAACIMASMGKAKDGPQSTGAGIAKNALRTMAVTKIKRTFVKVAAVLFLLMSAAAALTCFLRPKPVHVTVLAPRVDVLPTGPAKPNNLDRAENPKPPHDEKPEIATPTLEPETPPVQPAVPTARAPKPPKPPEPLEKVLARLPLRAPSNEHYIDLTWMIDPEIDAVVGAWTRQNNVLQSDGALYASLEVPYYSPAEYDLRVTFKPLVARDAVILLPMHGVTSFSWKMGAEGNSVCQFDLAAKPTPETDTAFRLNNMLKPGQRMTCVLEVRHTGVRAYLNEHLVCDLPTDYKNMGNGGFWTPRNLGVLGIGSWGTPTQFEKIEIAEIRGKGGPLRKSGENVARPPASPLPDEAAWKTAVKLLPKVNPARDAVAGVWSRKGGELSSDNSVRARIHIPYQPPEEYDLRVNFVHPNSEGEVDILLPRGESAAAFRIFIPDVWVAGFSSEELDNLANPTWCIMPEDKAEGRWSAVLRVRKEGIRAYLNGTLMSKLTPELSQLTVPAAWKLTDGTCLGLGCDQNRTNFKSVDLLPVAGEGKAVTPQRESGEIQNRP